MAGEGEGNFSYMDDKLYEAARSSAEGVDMIQSVADDKLAVFLGLTPSDQSNAVHIAAQCGNHKFISALLFDHIRIDPYELLCKTNSNGETPLHLAAQSGCNQTVQALLDAHHHVGGEHDKLDCWMERDGQGDTPLHIALRHGQNEIALLMLEKDWRLVSLYNNVGESLAYLAAQNFCPEFLQTILNADRDGRCSVSFLGPFGQTAFHPCRKLSGDIMSVAIEIKKNLLKVRDKKGKTVLHYAIEENRISTVEMLLKADNTLAYLHDEDGLMPLHIASKRGLIRMMQIILELSPQSIAIRDKHRGQTALHVIMDAWSLEACLQYTRMKELINLVDNDGNTPLHLALINFDFATADKLLKVEGINWRLTNKQGYSPTDLCTSDVQIALTLKRLDSASKVKEETNVAIFIRKDVVDADKFLDGYGYSWDDCLAYKGPEGESILHVAARDGHMNLIKRAGETDDDRHLLLSGKNYKGETPLHLAAAHGKVLVVKSIFSLVSNDTSGQNLINSTIITIGNEDGLRPWRNKSVNGDTPLHKALKNGHDEVALLLLQKDTELTCFDNNAKESPLYLAAENRCHAVVRDILSEGKYAGFSINGRDGQNVIHAAASSRTGFGFFKSLIGKQPDLLRKVDDNGKTPLHHAVEGNNKVNVWLILKEDKSGAFIYDGDGYTPLLRAAAFGYMGCTRIILDLCPHSAKFRDLSNNKTMLHLAKISPTLLPTLMVNQVAGELINEVDNDGNTALHCAILDGDTDKALVLLDTRGMNWMLKNKQHQSPTELCKHLWRSGTTKQRPIHVALSSLNAGVDCMPKAPYLISWIKYVLMPYIDVVMTDGNLKKLLDSIAVAAALLATITFAAAFTIPGGYNASGEAVRIKQAAVKVFMAADILAMLMSISILFWHTIRAGRRTSHKLQRFAIDSIIMLQIALAATVVAFISGAYAIGWSVKSVIIVPCILALISNLYTKFRPGYLEWYF